MPDDDSPPSPLVAGKYKNSHEASRIYLLPNLFTAGNMFFGFLSIIFCIKARYVAGDLPNAAAATLYTQAVACILGAFVCDALDGRIARISGRESLFGLEFDSIADTVSFGVAPAMMVFFIVLSPGQGYDFFTKIGWIIGFIYLLCVGVRLARFNVLTHPLLPKDKTIPKTKDFMGLPSPAGAGMIASLVLVLIDKDLKSLSLLLPFFMLLISILMVSNIPYPSFKHIDWNTQTRARSFILMVIVIAVCFNFHKYAFALIFMGYIFYGIFRYVYRSWIRRKVPGQRDFPELDPDDTF